MSEVYLITGANSGLGLDAVRQLVGMPSTEKIYMGCRSKDKADKAIALIQTDDMDIDKLHYVHYDAYSTHDEIFQTPTTLGEEPITGVILNAGGIGHDSTQKPVPPNQVLDIHQINLIAHIQLLEAIKPKLSKGCRIIYSGSEAARGLASFGWPPPKIGDTKEWFKDQLEGNYEGFDHMAVYGQTKAFAALYFAEWAHQHSEEYKVFVVSPGATSSNSGPSTSDKSLFESDAMPWHMKKLMPIMMPVIKFFGQMHSLNDGTARYVDAVTGKYDEQYATGTFIASAKGATGAVVDQTTLPEGEVFKDTDKQKTAFEALYVYTST